jgi:CHAT domain-containing protein
LSCEPKSRSWYSQNFPERAAQDKIATDVDSQIQTLEVGAKQRSPTAPSIYEAVVSANAGAMGSTRTFNRMVEYQTALGEATDKRWREYMKRLSKNDSRTFREQDRSRMSEEEVRLDIQREVEAELAPRFKDLFEDIERQKRGNREGLLQSIQSRLPDAAALIEMARFRPFKAGAASEAERWEPPHYGAYVIRHTGAPTFIDYGDAASIDALVIEFRRTLAVPRGTLAHDLGRRLDTALMQPLRAQLGATTEIYVSPEGLLNLVPFGALVDEQDRYLVETFRFNYLSTGRDLLREPPSSTARPSPAVVIADPAFDAGAGDRAPGTSMRSVLGHQFQALPGTAGEAEAIKALLPGAAVLTREQATETAMKSVAAPRILHVATHGFFLEDQDLSRVDAGTAEGPEDPMLRSGLVFAGANTGRSGADDGVLTALEAAALGLAGTELVVLSACETGVGDVRTGEGVFGLRRAFMAAGAETLVISLWRVDDDATRQLMTEFYRRLAKREGRAEALRQAALTLLRDPAHRHPFYWASFISTGEASPMRH